VGGTERQVTCGHKRLPLAGHNGQFPEDDQDHGAGAESPEGAGAHHGVDQVRIRRDECADAEVAEDGDERERGHHGLEPLRQGAEGERKPEQHVDGSERLQVDVRYPRPRGRGFAVIGLCHCGYAPEVIERPELRRAIRGVAAHAVLLEDRLYLAEVRFFCPGVHPGEDLALFGRVFQVLRHAAAVQLGFDHRLLPLAGDLEPHVVRGEARLTVRSAVGKEHVQQGAEVADADEDYEGGDCQAGGGGEVG
jgi:hypothetical protein